MHDKSNPAVPSTPLLATQIAQTISLRRHRRYRDRTKLFVIEGVRQFIQACDAGFDLDTILVSPVLLKQGTACKLVRRVAGAGTRKLVLTPEQFRSISTTEHASGIAAIVRQRWTPLHAMPVR